eukprot:554979-Prymnesium_polylepis.2
MEQRKPAYNRTSAWLQRNVERGCDESTAAQATACTRTPRWSVVGEAGVANTQARLSFSASLVCRSVTKIGGASTG